MRFLHQAVIGTFDEGVEIPVPGPACVTAFHSGPARRFLPGRVGFRIFGAKTVIRCESWRAAQNRN